ncbi:FecCD family ABC transporter permease [Fischerella thermalis]|jgi:iron complex transport system permease protein|uniref:ABC-type transporter, integral membrane subunit n=3 Tax=Fischerella TaxID=1190 RepID=G6FQM5_9CYAN|nr:iron ABC transporter permease [Fischerella thermalis]PMB08308.1 iron ABC transporter permease [Fischerella thermalis CCMEE 5273]PMB08587.1 iron ABC transporter permease [Fischerella thermalis CCMEE 5328]PMB28411.1 iron ABC transporter permease [Fischerella thermalis CCMEE 5319]PMB40629.1 iron ABC transporter permease [Fischerella thermalis CCMEE 5205]EHC18110.1 ABC-type transporter, integral membrane subunit [Fischerella thermalis JSC-11]
MFLRKIIERNRLVVATLLLCAALVVMIGISLSLGAVSITPIQLWKAIWRQGDPLYQTILWDLRLPRTLAAMLVGAALGTAGALLQGMLRNGLADPFLLGISAGAGLVAVAMFSFGVLQAWVPLAAWIGGLFTTIIIYFLARRGDGISVERLILGGVAVSSLFGAIQSVLLLMAEDGQVQAALNWLIGSLNGRGWTEVKTGGIYICVSLLLGCLLARTLNLLNLGDELAVGLGVSLVRSRILIGGIASLLAAGAVSIGGLIGFVGLIVPHGIRLLVGADYRAVLPLSAVGGAVVLTLADVVSRSAVVELPVGAVTALLGSPLFIWLLYGRQTSI